MKQLLFLKFLKMLKENPKLAIKLKVFAIVGGIGFFLISAFIVWISAAKINQVAQSFSTQGYVEALKGELNHFPKIQAANCWTKLQSLFAVDPWIEKSLIDQLQSLKNACFENNALVCEGANCQEIKNVDGRKI